MYIVCSVCVCVCEGSLSADVQSEAGAMCLPQTHGSVSVSLGSLYLPQDPGPFLINHHTG